MDTIEYIVNSKAGDEKSTLFLVSKFNPLLKKYSYKLSYEDSYDDLLLDFLVLLHDFSIHDLRYQSEGGIVSYIAASIYNSYIKKLTQIRRSKKLLYFSELSDDASCYSEAIPSKEDPYSDIHFKLLSSLLTDTEMLVINSLYYKGYTATEIAKTFGISRKTIYKRKNSAIEKLKKLFEKAI